jgi:hypothetical protein
MDLTPWQAGRPSPPVGFLRSDGQKVEWWRNVERGWNSSHTSSITLEDTRRMAEAWEAAYEHQKWEEEAWAARRHSLNRKGRHERVG